VDHDLVIEGKALVSNDIRNIEIGITDGMISAVGGSVGRGEKRIGLGSSRLILPGFVDPHVHFRDPGMTHKEDFSSGTLSAVHGGVTCVLDMPNTKPPVTDVPSLLEKKSAIKGKAYVDYGLFAAVTPGCNPGMLAHLVPGFKLFMGSTTGQILLNDDEEIRSIMQSIKTTGKRVSVHAEDDSMILKEVERSCRDHLRNRPAEAEYNAVRRLAQFKGMKINTCHNTTAEGVKMASELGFTTEVTLHHLFFDPDKNSGAEYKVNPPLRETAAREMLMKAFLENKITMFGTDHAPHTVSEKAQEFDSAPSGIPGVETSMPVVMDMVRKNTIPLAQAIRMGSEAPAQAFGLNKGSISIGKDADLSIFDMRNVTKIDAKRLHSKAGYSPYDGFDAVFPEMVIVRGDIQIKDGEFCGDKIGEDTCG